MATRRQMGLGRVRWRYNSRGRCLGIDPTRSRDRPPAWRPNELRQLVDGGRLKRIPPIVWISSLADELLQSYVRLADDQPGGGAGEAQFFRDHGEITQGPKFHRFKI